MITSNTRRDENDIEASAAGWILRCESGPLSPQERGKLEAWLAEDSQHRAAYLKLKGAWQFAAGLKTWRPAGAPLNPDLLVSRSSSVSRSFLRKPLAFAAAVLLTLIAGLVWFNIHDTYSTPVGGYQRVVLDDGSVLQLNTDSKVRVRFSAHRREIQLLRGEGYFDVAHDATRPFEVFASGAAIRAVGTAFSVRVREARRVEVIVVQGRVQLRTEDTEPPGIAQPRSGGAVLQPLLSAGESAETKPTGLRVKRIPQEELEHRLAWQTGRLFFKKESLAVVVQEFNRYNRRHIEIADPELSGLEVHGNFKATDLESFIKAIKDSLNVRVENTGNTIRLFAG